VLSTKNPLQSNVQVFGFAGAAKGIELTSAAKARNQRWRRARPQSRDSWQMATQAPGRISVEQALDQFPQLVAFLEACKELGELRFIATNAAVVFESTATLEKLFYAEVPRRGLYANIIDLSINLDLHILLSGIRAARFEQGASRGEPSTPTYIIRFLGHEKQGEEVVLSLFLSPVGEVSADRVALWERLRARFTSKDGPSANICVF
jgi:hypothetical protein